MARGLEAMGVKIEEGEDYLIVHGQNGEVEGGGIAQTHLDHRIAMSFLCMGLASKKSVKVDDGHAIATSFPIFTNLMSDLGAHITG
jgi:3-phosphoshikimate 1-carboxyvinyltransferase